MMNAAWCVIDECVHRTGTTWLPPMASTDRNVQVARHGRLSVIVAAVLAAKLCRCAIGRLELLVEMEMELKSMEAVELSGCHLVLFEVGGQAVSPAVAVAASRLRPPRWRACTCRRTQCQWWSLSRS